jgi:4-amino-4-deoxy-L-arabinose transferase-like glycosyltransferase
MTDQSNSQGRDSLRATWLQGSHWPVAVYLVLAFAILFFRLGASSLLDWDEGLYAQISKEIVRTHDWLTLHWRGQSWFEKPPLFMWLTAVAYKIGGISEFSARVVSALAAVALFGLLPAFGKILGDRWIGILAGLILLTNNEFLFRSRFGTTDILLTLFLWLAFYGFLRVEAGKARGWLVVGAALGFAVLDKSMAAAVGPAVIGASLLLDGPKKIKQTLLCPQFWVGILIAVVIVGPWHLIMHLEHGMAFWREYLGLQVVTRMRAGMGSFYHGGRLFYLGQLQNDFYPWFFPGLFALAIALRNILRERQVGLRLLLLHVAVVFVLYTAVQTKNPWYMLPLYPALALLTAALFLQAWKKSDAAALGAILLGGVLDALMGPPAAVAVFGALAVLAYLVLHRRQELAQRAVAAIIFGGILLIGAATLPDLYHNRETDVAHFGKMIARAFPQDQQAILIFGRPYGAGAPGPALTY